MDIGTGDGLFVYHWARQSPQTLFIGIDANRRPLQKISERIYRKPSKGGLPNILFVQAAVETLPLELQGIAHEVHINFPWGSLLAAVAGGNAEALKPLRHICAPDATLNVILGLDPVRDRSEMERLQLSELSNDYVETKLAARYRNAGFEIVRSESVRASDLKVETSWARRLQGNDKRLITRFQARAVKTVSSLESTV